MRECQKGFFLCVTLCITILASTLKGHANIYEYPPQPIKNLQNIQYKDKGRISKIIETLYLQAKEQDDAYQLTMPMLAAALNGDTKTYEAAAASFLEASNLSSHQSVLPIAAMAKSQKKPIYYYSWLLGRYLMASAAMNDFSPTTLKIGLLCQKILSGSMPRKPSQKVAYYTWSWAYMSVYYAIRQPVLYLKYKLFLRQCFGFLDAHKANDPSNIMWARIIGLYAAALARDKKGYNTLLNDMCGGGDIIQALGKISADGNGYRAWAMALTQLAAVVMRDKVTYDKISVVIEHASNNNTETPSGKILARVTSQLAIVNAKKLKL